MSWEIEEDADCVNSRSSSLLCGLDRYAPCSRGRRSGEGVQSVQSVRTASGAGAFLHEGQAVLIQSCASSYVRIIFCKVHNESVLNAGVLLCGPARKAGSITAF